MTRVIIVSSRPHQKRIVERLYELRVAHLVEFSESPEEPEVRIGRPLAEASEASAKLVRLRAMLRHLRLEGAEPAAVARAEEVFHGLETRLSGMETEVQRVAGEREGIAAKRKEIDERRRRLGPLAVLPLALEDYRGYENVAVFVGAAEGDVAEALAAAPDRIHVASPEGAFALFVPRSVESRVAEALVKAGFRPIDPPTGEGRPSELLARAERELQELDARLAKADAEVRRLAAAYGDFILQAEEQLSIDVEKLEAPLAFASTENAFIVDAWVPTTEVARVQAALEEASSGHVHFEVLSERDARDDGDAHDAAKGHAEHGGVPAREAPPTLYANPAAVRPFEFFTGLFSTPKHDEIDPTAVLAFAFPLFFGFMIGDAGYGILMMLLAYVVVRKLGRAEAARNLAIGLFAAGVVALFIGAVIFAEAFGIPFGASAHALHELEGAHVEPTCDAVMEHLKETTWACLVAQGGAEAAIVVDPVMGKLTDIPNLMVLSLLAAFVHLTLGLVFGIVNEVQHAPKHALAKVAWLALAIAFFHQIILMAPSPNAEALAAGTPDFAGILRERLGLEGVSGLSPVTKFATPVAMVVLFLTEGAIGLIEVPTLLSHFISYARLAGVAVAKGAMAFAFNSLFLVGMVLAGKGLLLIIVGGVLLVLTQLLVFVLGVLSSGIQAIRLHYVEFFLKFYKGGGYAFTPFGRIRKYTQST